MNAYIFDVDGVLTDPIQKKVIEVDLLPQLAKILNRGDIVTFNTGRSFSWINERVLIPFLEFIQDKMHLKNMFVAAEMGNVLVSYKNGKWHKELLDDPIQLALQETIKALVKKDFSESMFFDESKETMLSVEMKDGFNINAFAKLKDSLLEKISGLLMKDKYMHLNLTLTSNQIAIDVQYEDAGKRLGAERIQDWMIENNFKPEAILMFGDNISDIEMAKELEESYSVTFIFVNEQNMLDPKEYFFKIVFTKKKFTAGTLEYLKSIPD